MATIRFCKDGKISTLVLRELVEKGLEQFPHVGRRSVRGSDLVVTVRETNTDWLINVNHFQVLVQFLLFPCDKILLLAYSLKLYSFSVGSVLPLTKWQGPFS